MFVSSVSNAAMLVDVSMTHDWATLNISGVNLTPTTVTYPVAGTPNPLSSIADTDVGYGNPPVRLENTSYNDFSVSSVFNSPSLNLVAEYDGADKTSVTADASAINKTGFLESNRSIFYQASATGTATIDITTTLSGDKGANSAVGFYNVWLEAYDFETWNNTYISEFSSHGINDDAEDAADTASILTFDDLTGEDFFDPGFGCVFDEACSVVGEQITLSISFDVTKDKVYILEAGGGAFISTTVVPLPATAWMMLSAIGLLGGIVRKQNKV